MKSEQESSVDTNSEAVKKFMAERKWEMHSCSTCGRTFFSKTSAKMDVSVCGWHKCDKGDYPFRTYSKRKRMLTPAQISSRISEYFRSTGFNVATPMNIANFEGQTDRRLKLPNPKGGRCPAPNAREWTKDAVAPRRIGTGREFQNGRICHEPAGSFRFFVQMI